MHALNTNTLKNKTRASVGRCLKEIIVAASQYKDVMERKSAGTDGQMRQEGEKEREIDEGRGKEI